MGFLKDSDFSILDGHGHCQLHTDQYAEVELFIDAFMLGVENVNTDISTNPYYGVDYLRWTDWWGTGIPTLADLPEGDTVTKYYEPECADMG